MVVSSGVVAFGCLDFYHRTQRRSRLLPVVSKYRLRRSEVLLLRLRGANLRLESLSVQLSLLSARLQSCKNERFVDELPMYAISYPSLAATRSPR